MINSPCFNNKPNFQVYDGKSSYWISRSVAVVMVPIFQCRQSLWVPLGLRSSVMLCPNMWALPGGFIDWNENASDCVRRETWEELGLDLDKYGGVEPQPKFVC
jgi:8-oxo-dGTP pyrophosphatase MutT (NUDIX family)